MPSMIFLDAAYKDSPDTILGRYGHSLTWEIKAGAMGKPLAIASEWILSHFPDIREQLSIEEFIEEGSRMKAKLFREVEPMRGAAALVKGLVSCFQCLHALCKCTSANNVMCQV